MQSTEQYDNAREAVRRFINAKSTNEVVFTSGTTASLNLLAYSFGQTYVKPNDRIVITDTEHHSNIVPWQMLCQRTGAILEIWESDDSGALDPAKLGAHSGSTGVPSPNCSLYLTFPTCWDL